MIRFPTHHEMQNLEQDKTPLSVTIYAPYIEPSGNANSPNRIEFKNIVRQAEIALANAGANDGQITKTLDAAHKLLEDTKFWSALHSSLAVFANTNTFHVFHVPDPQTNYLLTVEDGFRLEPLKKAMQDDQPFYLLGLSHHRISLYEGGHYHLQPINVEFLPQDLLQALQMDEFPTALETHTSSQPDREHNSETFHGHEEKKSVDKKLLERYFHLIDKALHEFLRDKQAPLVLAGVEYLQPIYRKVNTYPHLTPEGIPGNVEIPERLPLDELHDKAWKIISQAK